MKGIDKLSEPERRDLRRTFCEQCGTDISPTGYSGERRLVLTTELKTSGLQFEGLGSGASFPEVKRSPLDRDHHFCSIECLHGWSAPKVR